MIESLIGLLSANGFTARMISGTVEVGSDGAYILEADGMFELYDPRRHGQSPVALASCYAELVPALIPVI